MALTLTVSLSACTSSPTDAELTDYDLSVDVPCQRWTSTDTLFFPIDVTDAPLHRTPLLREASYRVRCNIRISADCKLTNVPMNLLLQQTDTLGSPDRLPQVTRNLLRSVVCPAVRNADGRELGSTWGSLIQHEVPIDSLTMKFDSAGTYRILLIPAIEGPQGIEGVHSVGLALVRQSQD